MDYPKTGGEDLVAAPSSPRALIVLSDSSASSGPDLPETEVDLEV